MTVKASLFGEENASLLAILAQLIQQVQNAVKTVEGVRNTVDQVTKTAQQGATMLQRLQDIDSLQDVLGLLSWAKGAIYTLQRLDRGVTKLGYHIDRIDEEFRELFPTEQSLDEVPSSDFPKKAQEWNTALRESSTVAMRAQTSVESLQARADTQQQILEKSNSAQGIVAQLQAVVAGLALLHADLGAIETNLAAGLRVSAVIAGGQATQQAMVDEDNRRMMDGYTDDEPTLGPVLTELP